MNKNISVWRGFKEPPTNYHLWVNEENDILLYDGTEWKTIVDDNNYEDLRLHLAHFPKMGVIDNIPIINTELLEDEFSIYRLTQDVEVTLEYEKFDKTEPFVAKKGDLYIQCKIPTPNEFIPEAVSPIVTVQDAINENRPIVLKLSSKDADVELDIVEGVLKTVRRQLTPTWIISGTPSNAYIKHIKTNQYLSWDGSNYVLSTLSNTKFEFNLLGDGYEISRVGSSKALNPFLYTTPGVEIKEYNKRDPKNELVIIDPALYEFPIISSETVKTDFVKGAGFPYSLNFTANNSYYINSSNGVKVGDTPMKYFLCGTYEKLALVTSNNKVLIINGNTINVSDSSKRDFCLVPHGHTSNKSFAICAVSNPDKAINANAGIILGHNIVIWDTWDSNNGITFVPYASIVHKHIPLSNTTSSYSGLMSKEDKAKLDSFLDSSKYKTIQTAKSSPSTSGTSVEFIDTISQNAQGIITATKKSVRNASQSLSGLMSSSDKTKLDNITTIDWSVLDHLLKIEIKSTSPINLILKNELISSDELSNINLLELYSINDIINLTITTKVSVIISHNDITIQDDTSMYQDLTLSDILSSEILSLYIRKGLDVSINIIPWSEVRFISPIYNSGTHTYLFPAHKALTWRNVRPYISTITVQNNNLVYYEGLLVSGVSADDTVYANRTYDLQIP